MNAKKPRLAGPANYKGSPAPRRPDDDDDEPGGFEAQLAEMDMDYTSDPSLIGQGPENEETCKKWARPTPPILHPDVDNLQFQQIDIDHYIGPALAGMPGPQVGPSPKMRMYGVTMDGNSVCCHVHGFVPYLYVIAPKGFTNADCGPFKEALNKVVLSDMRSNPDKIQEAILEVSLTEKKNLYSYTGDENILFIRISVLIPRWIAATKRLREREIAYSKFDFQDIQAFETNIDFDIRFMVDTGVVGCSWIELPKGEWRIRSRNSFPSIESRCQIEFDVAWDKFIAHESEGEWSKVAPFRILSFDINAVSYHFLQEQKEDVHHRSPIYKMKVIKRDDVSPYTALKMRTCHFVSSTS